jgi:hypothetical protein
MKKVANGIYEKELLLIRDSVMAWSWQVATQDDDDAQLASPRHPTPPHQGMTVWMHSLTGGSAEHAYYVRLHV